MDPAVTLLLHTLEKTISTSKNLDGVRNETSKFRCNLNYCKSVLENWTESPIEEVERKILVEELSEAAYEAVDALEDFAAYEIKYKSKSTLLRLAHSSDYPRNLLVVMNRFDSIKEKMKKLHQRKIKQDNQRSSNIHPKPRVVPMIEEEEEHVVGFDGEVQIVMDLLSRGTDDLEVISIIGMAGLGKTTLAKMIYSNPTLEDEFPTRIWTSVSKDCNVREVFFSILGSFTRVTNTMNEKNGEDLSEQVRKCLEGKKYLIVFDDVWEKRDWDAIQKAFPDNKNSSRILITSRNEEVAEHANPKRTPHKLKCLTEDESWKLLKIKALGSEECPYEDLAKLGRKIAYQCSGLPLALVVMGGILRGKGTEIEWWTNVSENVPGHINLNLDPKQNMKKLIAWSFYQLPYSLKTCLLYFGMFPEDYQISASRLIRIWIAEGFVAEISGVSLEKIAEQYLEDLVKRNLVIVGELRSNGKIKTCHIHDLIHAFCKEMAAEENLYQEVKEFDASVCSSSNPEFQSYRRVCIHSQVLSYINSNYSTGHIRSFLCSSKEEITLQNTQVNCIPRKFKLLRVFDGKPIAFPTFPRDLQQLVHLKYLVLSINCMILPQAISNLWNLQTFVVHTTSHTLETKVDLFKMLQLRHLETNATMSWPTLSKARNKKEKSARNANLTTLSAITPETCTKDAFDRVPNIRKLGIQGQLAKILNGEDILCSFDNLMKLESLENLKLINDVPNFKSDIVGLPHRFPPYVKKLMLKNTRMDWSHISTLGKLENLEVLKLKENAFMGKLWQPKDGEFPALKVLNIERTDLVFWEASDSQSAFPSLRHLSIRHCTYLREIKLCLANIPGLERVDLFWTTISAVAQAKKIQYQKGKEKGFKLSVYPPEHENIVSDSTQNVTYRDRYLNVD